MEYDFLFTSQARWFVAAWLFCIGGAFGSFLNVVIYRLPAGMSLLHPGSRCPNCEHPIRWHDNVPIVGWLVLRGRCRDCGTSISPRYPAIEATVAGLFVLLAWVELFSDGANLPVRPAGTDVVAAGAAWTIGQLTVIYAYHLFLLCALLAGSMIEYDGYPWPACLTATTLACGFLAPLAWPELRPVPCCPSAAWLATPGWVQGAADGLAGLAAGAILGLAVWVVTRSRGIGVGGQGPGVGEGERGALVPRWFKATRRHKASGDLAWAFGLVGVCLGWQAAVAVSLVALAAGVAAGMLGRVWPWPRRIPVTFWVFLAATGWIVAWKFWLSAPPGALLS
ncbi:MAG: A24 family peptidase [Pirellulales bacterium]